MTDVSIGKTLYISVTPPTANTIAAFTALTWTKVNGIVSIGQIGFNHATIEAPDLETGITETMKGAQSGVAGNMAFREITGDAGQAAVVTANATRANVAIQIVDPNGTNSDYWQGIVHSLIDTEATVTSYEGATFTFVPNAAKVRGPRDAT